MKEQFVDYETAKMLKELGFKDKCFAFYYKEKMEFKLFDFVETTQEWEPNFIKNSEHRDDYVSTPTFQQVKQWLWAKYKIIIATSIINIAEFGIGVYEWRTEGGGYYYKIHSIRPNTNPITAETEGIKKAVEYLHKNHNH